MFESIQDIQHKIETVSTLIKESTGDAKTHLEDSILSLYKEKYDAILEEKENLDAIFESGILDVEDYDSYKYTLEKMEEETEKIAYPYMTEAAAAISTVIIQNEMDEIKKADSAKTKNIGWIKKRIKMYERICMPEIPFSSMKKKKVKQEDFESVAGKVKVSEEKIYKFVLYYVKEKVICGIAYSREDLKNYKIYLDSAVKKRSDYYTTAIGIDNKLAIKTNNFLASFKKDLMKEFKKNEKAVKECVLEAMEKDDSIDSILSNISEAVSNEMIDKSTGDLYKEYVEQVSEKAMLEESLEPRW